MTPALSGTAGLIRTAGFHVEQQIEPNLPRIVGDLPALSQCVQNLITNALKYGSEQKWIGIQARLTEHGLTGKEVQISVSDRGIGIAPEELRHIFEPFYRSPSVTAAQIHGTGLGLPLAKSIVEAMNGPGYGEERSGARKHVYAAFALCGTLGSATGSQDDRGGFLLIASRLLTLVDSVRLR